MKRPVEAALAAVLLVLLSPAVAIVAVLVRWRLGAPILFRQVRPGQHGRLFSILKFRTMRDTRDAAGELLPDELRLTRFGKLLRASSLDELPSLVNVLRGDMSFVGPRPLLVEYLDRYTPEQARRHEVRPGITGLAQVSGRNELPWENRFALDVYYVDHRCARLDLRILARTVAKVARRDGISADGHATAPRFMGSAQT